MLVVDKAVKGHCGEAACHPADSVRPVRSQSGVLISDQSHTILGTPSGQGISRAQGNTNEVEKFYTHSPMVVFLI